MNIYKWIKNLFAGAVTEEYMGVPVVPTKPAKKISKAALSKLTKTQQLKSFVQNTNAKSLVQNRLAFRK